MNMPLKPAYKLLGKPKLVIVDGGGTLFDPGNKIPTLAFRAAFKEKGLSLKLSTIGKQIGRQKKEHIQFMLNEAKVSKQFQLKYSRKPNESDVDEIYNIFKKRLYPAAKKTEEIPGVKEAAYKLKEAGIPLVMTTGYDRKMVNETIKKLPWLKDVLAASFTSDDAKKGRPAPDMIYLAMKHAHITNLAQVINVGDTRVDAEAADNAHVPGIIVTTGSIIKKKAKQVNQQLGRKHLVLLNLAKVIETILDNTLINKIKKVNAH